MPSVSVGIMGLLRLSISSWCNFGRLYLSKDLWWAVMVHACDPSAQEQRRTDLCGFKDSLVYTGKLPQKQSKNPQNLCMFYR